jgi:hypothetical protein
MPKLLSPALGTVSFLPLVAAPAVLPKTRCPWPTCPSSMSILVPPTFPFPPSLTGPSQSVTFPINRCIFSLPTPLPQLSKLPSAGTHIPISIISQPTQPSRYSPCYPTSAIPSTTTKHVRAVYLQHHWAVTNIWRRSSSQCAPASYPGCPSAASSSPPASRCVRGSASSAPSPYPSAPA